MDERKPEGPFGLLEHYRVWQAEQASSLAVRRIQAGQRRMEAESARIEAEIAARTRIAEGALRLEELEEELWFRRGLRDATPAEAQRQITQRVETELLLQEWRAIRQQAPGSVSARSAPALRTPAIEVAHSAADLADAALFQFARLCKLDGETQQRALAALPQTLASSYSTNETTTIANQVRALLERASAAR